jgi:hypothetical protein
MAYVLLGNLFRSLSEYKSVASVTFRLVHGPLWEYFTFNFAVTFFATLHILKNFFFRLPMYDLTPGLP